MNPPHVTLIEVGPRDGLQHESTFLPTQDKIKFIQLLTETGVRYIEVTSFVSPLRIPQLRDHTEVLQGLKPNPQVTYAALVPNLQGFEASFKAGIQAIALFTAASETFNQRNIHCSIAESLERIKPLIPLAKQHHITIRAHISCAVGCPFEGPIPPSKVAQVTEALLQLGVDEISLADTIGVGTPKQILALLAVIQPLMKTTALALHLHDTYGQALVNLFAALEKDVSRFDTAVAGLGGCPYAPHASGNVATEEVLYCLHGLGVQTGIDLSKMAKVGEWVCKKLNRPNQSKVAQALLSRTALK